MPAIWGSPYHGEPSPVRCRQARNHLETARSKTGRSYGGRLVEPAAVLAPDILSMNRPLRPTSATLCTHPLMPPSPGGMRGRWRTRFAAGHSRRTRPRMS